MSLQGPRDPARVADEKLVDAYVAHFFPQAEPPEDDEPAPTVPTSTPQAYPNVHQGTRETADSIEDEQFAAYMQAHFPQMRAGER